MAFHSPPTLARTGEEYSFLARRPSGRAQVVERAVCSAVTSTDFPVLAACAAAAVSVTGFAFRLPSALPRGSDSSRPRLTKTMPVAARAAASTAAVVRLPGARRQPRLLPVLVRVIRRVPLLPLEPARDRALPGPPMMTYERAVVTLRIRGGD